MNRLILWALSVLAVLPIDAAENWPRFRGPNGQGTVDDVVFDPKVLTEPPLWTAKLPGVGVSSPIIDGNRVYITSATEYPGRNLVDHYVLCYEAASGKPLWDRKEPLIPFKKHRLNSYASTTPVIDGDRVFFSVATPAEYRVYAFDKKTTKQYWMRKLGPYQSEHGIGYSLIVADGLVIVPNEQKEKEQAGKDCEILALNAETGETAWRLPRKVLHTPASTPCLHNGVLLTTSSAHGVSGIDPKTGTEMWSLRPMTLRVVSSPVFCDDLVFVSNGAGGAGREMFAARIRDGNTAAAAEVAYELKKPLVIPYVPTSVVGKTPAGKRLFTVGDFGDVTCLDPVTGNILGTVNIEGAFYGSPIILGNVLIVVSLEGVLYALSVAETPEVLCRVELGEASKATPAYADGRLFVRTDSQLFVFDLKIPQVPTQ